MDPAAGLSCRDALHTVHAAFVFELAEYALALDLRDHFFGAAYARYAHVEQGHFPALFLGKAGIHAEELGREQACLVPARARADLEEDVLVVARVLRHEHQPESLLHLVDPRPELLQFRIGHGPEIGIGLLVLNDLFGIPDLFPDILVSAVMVDDIFYFGSFPGILLVLLMIGSDPGIGKKAGQFIVFFSDCVEFA